MSKKAATLAVIGGVAAGLLLGVAAVQHLNDSNNHNPTPAANVKMTNAAAPVGVVDVYHQLVRDNIPQFAYRSDADLDEIGRATCEVLDDDSFDASTTWVLAVAVLHKGGLSGRNAGRFITYAEGGFCPDKLGTNP